MIRDLASLLAPVEEAVFFDHFLKKQRLHVKAGQPDRAKDLLPWSMINQLIGSDALPADRLRIIRAGMDLPRMMYRRKGGSGSIRAGTLRGLLEQGTSIVINFIDNLVPQIGYLEDALERRLAHRIGINAYLSFGQGSAFKAHWDDHDVLVLQVHGRKRWRSYGSLIPLPVEEHKSQKPASGPVWEDILEPGDLLYLPRGEMHEAAVESGASSVHLTIGITARRGVDYVKWLSEKAASELAFRKDITRLGGDEALRQQDAELRARLHALVDSTTLDDFLKIENAERTPRPTFTMGRDEELTEQTTVVPSLRRRIAATEDSGAEAVEIGGEQYRLSANAQRVLVSLVDLDASKFGELARALPGLTEADVRTAVLELARNGLVGFESPSGA